MPFRPVIDEGGVQTGFDAGDPALVDIGLFLFPGRNFDVQVIQILPVHAGNTQLLGLSCVD